MNRRVSAGLYGCMLVASAALAQSTPDDQPAPAAAPPARQRPQMGLRVPLTAPPNATQPAAPNAPPPALHRSTELSPKAVTYYSSVWGVDHLRASYTSSGNLIRFSYRVRDPKLAAALGDHQNTPELVGVRSNAVLHIPTMEKIGPLRQMSPGEAGKEYWMVFSNKGDLVKPGDEVIVIIGKFRATGLIVQ